MDPDERPGALLHSQESVPMPQALQRLQRALRHLHEVIWHHNFDLDPGPGASCLYMELWPLEPLACVRLHIQVVPSGVTVRTAVCMARAG